GRRAELAGVAVEREVGGGLAAALVEEPQPGEVVARRVRRSRGPHADHRQRDGGDAELEPAELRHVYRPGVQCPREAPHGTSRTRVARAAAALRPSTVRIPHTGEGRVRFSTLAAPMTRG